MVAHFAPALQRAARARDGRTVTRNIGISVRDIMDGCDADLRA
ncbi:MAG: hypothetical protein ACLTG4_03390 [Oscillospiraceae bacterium]